MTNSSDRPDPVTNRSVTFREDLEKLLNSYSMENGSDTPDFILAEYLADCLKVFDNAVTSRSKWYSKDYDCED